MVLTEAAAALADRQSGVISVTQLREVGVSRETIRWRSGRHWRMVLPGVLALQTGLPTEEQRLVAALLVAGEGSWLASTTAAALHGVRGARLGAPIRVLVPAPRRPRTVAWVQVRSTTVASESVVERGPLRLSCVARAVIDAAAETPHDRSARGIVLDAVQRHRRGNHAERPDARSGCSAAAHRGVLPHRASQWCACLRAAARPVPGALRLA